MRFFFIYNVYKVSEGSEEPAHLVVLSEPSLSMHTKKIKFLAKIEASSPVKKLFMQKELFLRFCHNYQKFYERPKIFHSLKTSLQRKQIVSHRHIIDI